MKIGVKLTTILVLLAIVGVTITVSISFYVTRKGIKKRIDEHLQSVAILKEYRLNDFYRERINDIDHMTKDSLYRKVFLGGTKVEIRNILKEKLVYEKELIELFILNMDGEVYLSTDEKQEGKIKSHEKYFIEGKKWPFIKSFYYDLTLQQPAITISAPIRDEQGSLSGLLVGRVNLKGISHFMTERTGLGETGETYLVNRSNYLVTESRFEEGLALKKLISTKGVKDCLKGISSHKTYKNYRGTPVLGFYKWIPERQVCLLAEISQKEAFVSINRLKNILILVGIGIVILVVIVGFFFSKTISKPLGKLIRGTKIIGNGDLEHRVDVRTKDEIGKLASAFNDMTEKHQKTEEALQKTHANLERRVEERTVELSKSNEQLKREIKERKQAEKELVKHREHLEEMVRDRTTELDKRISEVEQLNSAMVNLLADLRVSNENLELTTHRLSDANKELESFSYSVSHDLRAPLRAIDGFSQILVEDYGDKLDEGGQHQLDVIQGSARQMGQLIDDLLAFSRLGRKGMSMSEINMGVHAQEIFEQLQLGTPGREVKLKVDTLPSAYGDRALIREVLVNFLSNAMKFTRPGKAPVIEVTGTVDENENVYSIKDKGVGFDMKYADKLFQVFQRLHSAEEYEGTGIGLALVQRIIHRHGGRVWAEGKVNKGATFYFTLPRKSD
ncbi:MAG: HAMP domain-containing protein [Deltaproteobacteria bacterium]|nr:HAMP domain-containing protein [Deltaproteobacteria bacterium]